MIRIISRIVPLILMSTVSLMMPQAALAEQRWPDQHVAWPFICHADFRLDSYRSLLQEMAQLEGDLNRILGVDRAREPVQMYLFDKKSTYQRYMKQYFPSVPYRRALFVKNRGPGMVFAYRNHSFDVDLRHESTHALLHASLPMVPLWLDEGLAEYFEMPPRKRAFDHPHLAKLKWNIRFGTYPTMEKLENIHQLKDLGEREYRYAWAWVHFMLHGPPQAHKQLIHFLADIQAHAPPGVLSRRLEREVPNLERRFIKHFKQWKRPAATANSRP